METALLLILMYARKYKSQLRTPTHLTNSPAPTYQKQSQKQICEKSSKQHLEERMYRCGVAFAGRQVTCLAGVLGYLSSRLPCLKSHVESSMPL
jgi:hypothetical protein